MTAGHANELVAFGDELWLVPGDDVRMYGIPFRTRMTVVRLSTGGLWLHSPVAPTEPRRAALEALGPVEHLVAPNKIHSLGVLPWKELYPRARVWLSPEFLKRHPGTACDGVLGDEAPAAYREDLDQRVFRGNAFLDEMVFFHRRSRTLIVTDLIQRHEPDAQGWFWTAVKRWAGVLGAGGGVSRDLRAAFRDRAAAERSARDVLRWDFEALVIGHGTCAREGGKEVFTRAFDWLDLA